MNVTRVIVIIAFILMLTLVPTVFAGGIEAGSVIGKTKGDITIYKPTTYSKGEIADKISVDNIYLFDAKADKSTAITTDSNGVLGNALSDGADITVDGLIAVFHSWSTNFVYVPDCANVFSKDVKSGEIKLVKDHSLSPAISEDGRYISYEYSPSPDGGTLPMLMLYDTTTGKEIEICKTSGGNKAGWYMPDIRIEKNIIYFHSTYWGELREYQYNIEKGDLT